METIEGATIRIYGPTPVRMPKSTATNMRVTAAEFTPRLSLSDQKVHDAVVEVLATIEISSCESLYSEMGDNVVQ